MRMFCFFIFTLKKRSRHMDDIIKNADFCFVLKTPYVIFVVEHNK